MIEVRQDPAAVGQTGGAFMVTNSGQRATQTRAWLGYADGERSYATATGAIPNFPDLRSAKFHLTATRARELRVWLHRVTPDGQSENLPALVKVSSGEKVREFQIDVAGKQSVLPLRDIAQKESKGSPGEAIQLEVEVRHT